MSTDEFLPFCRPAIDDDDIEAVTRVLRSGWITTGPEVLALEAAICERLGCKHAVALSSATAAMHCYLLASGIGPGDEVITPSMTWVSTINLITLLGATPVFVDVDADDLMITAEAIERALTEKTRLVIPVHFAGAPLDLDRINEVTGKHGTRVVEDAAHALGTVYKGRPVGAAGDAIFSLQATKNVTAAEGGVLVTGDDALASRVRRLRFHGLGVDAYDRNTHGRAPQAEVLEPGFKYNLPDVCAALGLSQLRRIDAINAQRKAIADYYLEALQDIPEISPLSLPGWDHAHAWHLFVVRLTEASPVTRDRFIELMKAQEIGCGIHFLAVHMQKYYRDLASNRQVSLPNTEWNSARICSLPLFPDMTMADAARVITAIKSIFSLPV
jgi:UDP-4-amino-4-deoxy-L-arabinose-oxoglutarate aminotransferase